MATIPKVLTYEQMLDLPQMSDWVEEVIDGEVYVMPPNKVTHVFSIKNLADLLESGLDRSKTCVLITNFGLLIREDPVTCRVPDLAVYVRDNMVVKDGYFRSPPALIAEVLSPGNKRRDVARLLRDYESVGVPEVWMLSPKARGVEILHLIEGRLQRVAVRDSGQIAPLLFPAILIDIEAIWA